MSAQHGFLNHLSRLATQNSTENYPSSFSSDFVSPPDHSGINNNPNVNPQNTGTILSPDASRFEQQPWLPPPQSVRHLPNDNDLPPLPPTPNQPSLNFEHSSQPHISFEDQPLFPPPARPQLQTHNQSNQSIASPSGVDAILQRLGHNTTSSQFTHRPIPPSNTSIQYSNRPSTHNIPYISHVQYLRQKRLRQEQLRQKYHNRALGKQNINPLYPDQRMSGSLNSPSEIMKDEELIDWLQVGGGDGSEFSSPNFAHIHDPSVNLTISPQDIFSYQTSTPLSLSLMSPFLDDESSYETSPLFVGDHAVGGEDAWPSLFPDESPFEPNMDADIQDILNSGVDEIKHESSSSPSASPTTRSSTSGRKGSTTGAGVKKRTAPLPPIVVEDPADHVAVKRARNTLAARKSREKKVKKMEEMEQQIEELKAQVEHWKQLCQLQGRMPSIAQ